MIATTFAESVVESPPNHSSEHETRHLNKHEKEIDAFFDAGIIPSLTFEFNEKEWSNLKRDNRRYVEGTMTDATGKSYKHVAVKLKGSTGSFKGPDAKPGLTVSFEKYQGAHRFHGIGKLHLNNCAQDETYLLELIAGEMARAAGVPASRCSHALVRWNGRELGLYVLKEAFTHEFLSKFFEDSSGDLYDGGSYHDLDEKMEKDMGDPKDREELNELLAALREPDAEKRWARIDSIVDVDQFISFTAMESLLAHWDGYNFNRNNYRVYFDPKSKKAEFILHGMDETLTPTIPVVRKSEASLGVAIFSNPVWKDKYRARMEEIYTNILKPIDWPARVTEVGNRVKAALEKNNPQLAKDFDQQIQKARVRVEQRLAAIEKQLAR